jgi:ATP-dependent exoDNAse (exonuclease V) beta subunit
MWEKVLSYELITFESIRKMVEINHMCKDYIDKNYNMIFIDESQDFDNTMLKILLEDTVIPKIFVGDPKQAIYEWKGSINAFDKLPPSSLILEFYSTFRVGNPACDQISAKFNDCWMISKSSNMTVLEYNTIPDDKYVYLFRSWKNLLKTAQNIKNIWIYNYDSQIEYIKKLHSRLQISKLDEDELNEFSDDLPKFLLKMSFEELDKLLNKIKINIVNKEVCNVEFYTIHSYKGLENDIIRIYNDIDIRNEQNLYYVALTRGIKKIILDIDVQDNDNLRQTRILNF